MRYAPCWPVIELRTNPLALFRAVTVTAGTRAPDSSCTSPRRVEDATWAWATEPSASNKEANNRFHFMQQAAPTIERPRPDHGIESRKRPPRRDAARWRDALHTPAVEIAAARAPTARMLRPAGWGSNVRDHRRPDSRARR